MKTALAFRDVVRRFGRRVALDGLSFEVPTGSLTGFVGHNGAGKTTAFSIAGGFLSPHGGNVDILGRGPFDPTRMKGLVGILPQDAELPDRHTPRELLRHLARLQGLSVRDAALEVDRVMGLVLLEERATSRIASLSHGMRRRVAIATALLGRPPLVLLDEPLSGLDPLQAHAVRAQLVELRKTCTLVVSSHDLADLERMSDHVIMLERGRCLRQGTLAEVTHRSTVVRWTLAGSAVPVEELARRLPAHRFLVHDHELVQEAPDGELDSSSLVVMNVLANAGVAVREVRRGVALEQRFLEDLARKRLSAP